MLTDPSTADDAHVGHGASHRDVLAPSERARRSRWAKQRDHAIANVAADRRLRRGCPALAVLCALRRFKSCWASHAALADLTGLSRRGVIDALAVLDGADLVQWTGRRTDAGRQKSHIYTVVHLGTAELERVANTGSGPLPVFALVVASSRDGTSAITNKTIAAKLRCSVAAVSTATAALMAAGHLRRQGKNWVVPAMAPLPQQPKFACGTIRESAHESRIGRFTTTTVESVTGEKNGFRWVDATRIARCLTVHRRRGADGRYRLFARRPMSPTPDPYDAITADVFDQIMVIAITIAAERCAGQDAAARLDYATQVAWHLVDRAVRDAAQIFGETVAPRTATSLPVELRRVVFRLNRLPAGIDVPAGVISAVAREMAAQRDLGGLPDDPVVVRDPHADAGVLPPDLAADLEAVAALGLGGDERGDVERAVLDRWQPPQPLGRPVTLRGRPVTWGMVAAAGLTGLDARDIAEAAELEAALATTTTPEHALATAWAMIETARLDGHERVAPPADVSAAPAQTRAAAAAPAATVAADLISVWAWVAPEALAAAARAAAVRAGLPSAPTLQAARVVSTRAAPWIWSLEPDRRAGAIAERAVGQVRRAARSLASDRAFLRQNTTRNHRLVPWTDRGATSARNIWQCAPGAGVRAKFADGVGAAPCP